jgi:hypothetical protein
MMAKDDDEDSPPSDDAEQRWAVSTPATSQTPFAIRQFSPTSRCGAVSATAGTVGQFGTFGLVGAAPQEPVERMALTTMCSLKDEPSTWNP